MNSIQDNNRIPPCFNNPNLLKPPVLPSCPNVLCVNAKLSVTNSNSLKSVASESPCQLQFAPFVKHKRHAFVSKRRHQVTTFCRLGRKDKSAGVNEGSPYKAPQKATGKQQSVEDVLRQQMRNKEYYDEGSGNNPPRGRGGYGDGGNGSEGSGDEGVSGASNETMQVILATLGFIFVYVYIITGEELVLLARDYNRFLFQGKKSARLKRAMHQWRKFVERLNVKMEYGKFWLDKSLITNPTWNDSPEKYKRILGAPVESDHDDNDDDDDDDDEENDNSHNDEHPWP